MAETWKVTRPTLPDITSVRPIDWKSWCRRCYLHVTKPKTQWAKSLDLNPKPGRGEKFHIGFSPLCPAVSVLLQRRWEGGAFAWLTSSCTRQIFLWGASVAVRAALKPCRDALMFNHKSTISIEGHQIHILLAKFLWELIRFGRQIAVEPISNSKYPEMALIVHSQNKTFHYFLSCLIKVLSLGKSS